MRKRPAPASAHRSPIDFAAWVGHLGHFALLVAEHAFGSVKSNQAIGTPPNLTVSPSTTTIVEPRILSDRRDALFSAAVKALRSDSKRKQRHGYEKDHCYDGAAADAVHVHGRYHFVGVATQVTLSFPWLTKRHQVEAPSLPDQGLSANAFAKAVSSVGLRSDAAQ